MKPDSLLQTLRDECADRLRVDAVGDQRISVQLPLLAPSGLPIVVDAVRVGDGWFLTDNGATLHDLHLTGYNTSTEARTAAIDDVARAYGAKLEGDHLVTPPTTLGLGQLTAFGQALTAVGGLTYADPIRHSTGAQFRTVVSETVHSVIDPARVSAVDGFRSERDREGLFEADIGLFRGPPPSSKKPTKGVTTVAVLFVASSNEIAERAATKSLWWSGQLGRSDGLIDAGSGGAPRIGLAPSDRADSDAMKRLRSTVDRFIGVDPDDYAGEGIAWGLSQSGVPVLAQP